MSGATSSRRSSRSLAAADFLVDPVGGFRARNVDAFDHPHAPAQLLLREILRGLVDLRVGHGRRHRLHAAARQVVSGADGGALAAAEVAQLLLYIGLGQPGQRGILGPALAGGGVAERAGDDLRLASLGDDLRHRNVRVRLPVGRIELIVDARQRVLLVAVGDAEQFHVVELGRRLRRILLQANRFLVDGKQPLRVGNFRLRGGLGGVLRDARRSRRAAHSTRRVRRGVPGQFFLDVTFAAYRIRGSQHDSKSMPRRIHASRAAPCPSPPSSWRVFSLARCWCMPRGTGAWPGASSRPRPIRPAIPPATRAPG